MSYASRTFWSRLAGALGDGRRVLLAVVAESSVHSPGTAGAKMFVAEDGERLGTIGGGAMELRVIERAAEVLGTHARDGWAEQAELHHRRTLDPEVAERGAEKSGMICAGRQTNLYALLRPEANLDTVESLVQVLRSGGEGWWGLDSSGLLTCGESPMAPRRTRHLHRDSGADTWQFTESLYERRRLAILGGGHCGQALARLMSGVGWQVSVWETRPALIEQIRDDGSLDGTADVHLVGDFRDAATQIELPEVTPVVVMSTDVPNDVRALHGVLAGDQTFPFVGAMGSAAKLEEIRRRLRELGVADERIGSIVAPVGLPIDSDTPAEIAVSVAAQLLQRRHEWLDG